jgi:GT2 family glycosyltransferase
MTKAAIVVVSYNRPDLLETCLISVLASSIVPQIIIVADRPNNEMLEFLAAVKMKNVIVIASLEAGLYHHWNIGIKATDAEYVLVSNDDIVFSTNAIEGLIKVLDEDKNVWCVCPRQTKGDDLPKGMMRVEALTKPEFTEGFTGSCFMVRKEVITRFGFFSEAYRLWGADTEFSDMLTYEGHPSVISSASWVHHFGSVTVRSLGLNRKKSIDRFLYAKRRRPIREHYLGTSKR